MLKIEKYGAIDIGSNAIRLLIVSVIEREGKDVSHNKALAQGGTNKDGVKVESASANRSRNLKKPPVARQKKSTRR